MNYEILAFDDNTDGQAYLADIEYSYGLRTAFNKAYVLLPQHDHVCITSAETFLQDAPITFTETAPYSITLEMGHLF